MKGSNEKKVEEWLLANIEHTIEEEIFRVKALNSAPLPDTEKKRNAILRKMNNAKVLFIEGDIDKAEYDARKNAFQEQLNSLPSAPEVVDTKDLEEFLTSNWKEIYKDLTNPEKRVLWRSVLKYIEVDNDGNLNPIFF